jgi:hypothetical protein
MKMPFTKAFQPMLKLPHVKQLSEGGNDTVNPVTDLEKP